jgi:murein DD-endopeptidase MepM/ murein hydrolase activator NlpD
MALENPITSDDLTIDFAALLDMSVSNRVQAAASDNTFAQALMASLTPIQMAKAFPDYYRQELPDISNFILANRYLDETGKGAFDQQGGGDPGKDTALYDGEKAIPEGQKPIGVPDVSIEDMQAELLKKGIDVNNIYDLISKGLSADDPQVQFLKDEPADKLAKMGIEQFKTDDGKVMLRKAPEMSDQEISSKISGKIVAKEDASENQKAVIDFANRWNISPQAAAGVLKIESGVTSNITGGGINKKTGKPDFHGVFQLQTAQISGLTEKAGFGSLTPDQYKKLSVADQLKVMDEYYKQAGITPEFFTGDPQTDASKMWALQLAPSRAKKIDYNDPNAVISRTDQASTIEARNELVTVGSAGSGSIAGGEEFLGDSFTKIDGNATPEQIAKFKEEKQRLEKEAFTKEKFNEASPTSIEANLTTPSGENQVLVNEQGYSVPATGTMMHEGHGGTSEFGYGRGRLHKGVDIYSTDPETGKLRVGSNAPVIAPMDAKVTMIMKDRGKAGNYIEIQDKNGNRHRFLHTDESPALNPTTGEPWKVGESVTQGQTITNITGSGTKFDQKVKELGGDINAAVSYFDRNGWGSVNKPHLHYEVRDSRGKLLDPSVIFPEYSGEDKEKMSFSNKNDKLKHLLVTGQITKDDYDKQMQNDPKVSVKQENTNLENTSEASVKQENTNLENNPKNKKPLSIIEYSRPTEDAEEGAEKPAPSASGKTMLISAGTNDWGNKDPEVTYNNLVEMAKQAREKGYNPVFIAPVGTGKFKKVNETVNRVATELGVKVEQPQEYAEDGYHPTQKEAKRIAGLYPGSVAVGDSIANRIGTYIKDGKTYATDGIQSGVALDKLNTQVESVVTPEQAKPVETASATQTIQPTPGTPAESVSATDLAPIQTAEATPTAAAPEPIVYDGRRELFQTAEAVVGEQPAIAKLSKPSVIPPGTNKHQADMGNATSGGAFPSAEEITEAPAPVQVAEATPTVVAPAPIQTAEATPTVAAKLSKPSVIPPGTNKHQADMGNATSGGAFPSLAPTAETPAPIQTAEAPAPVKSAEAAPAPVQVAEAISVPTAGTEEVRTFRTGGSPDVQDDENLSVFDEDGSLKWKMNSGEGIYVKPKDTEYADDKINELSGRVDEIDQRSDTPEKNQPKAAPDKSHGRPEKNWQQNASSVTYSIGSQGRAFKRTKFQNEGFHFNRSAPNSTSS